MADQLNMAAMNLNGQQGPPAPNVPGGRSYIPPHMRAKMGGPPQPQPGPPGPAPVGPGPMAAAPPPGGQNNNAWAKYVFS